MAIASDGTRGWLGPALVVVTAVTFLRWVLLAFDQTDLFVDEAQYWLWGQDFAFGYYSKPPLIAWLIGAVTSAAGSDNTFWVRMPGAALHGATALILASIADRLFGAKVAVLVACAYVTLPMVAVGSLLISTDTVMAPFFAAALLWHLRLVQTGSARYALLAGGTAGLAFLAKYAALYFLIAVAVAAILRSDMRVSWGNAGLLLAAFTVVISPNVGWNLSHQLATVFHTADNVGWVRLNNPLAELNLAGLLEFVVSQFVVFGPVLFGILLMAMLRNLGDKRLMAFIWPILLLVSLQGLLGGANANWGIAAYFAGTVVAIGLLQHRPGLLRLSLLINGAVCVILPVLTLLPDLAVGDEPVLKRYLGRAALSQQILAHASETRAVAIVADRRDVLADLFYTGRDSSIPVYAMRPKGRPANHYEQTYPAPLALSGPIILVTSTAPVCETPVVSLSLPLSGGAYDGTDLGAYLINARCLDAAG